MNDTVGIGGTVGILAVDETIAVIVDTVGTVLDASATTSNKTDVELTGTGSSFTPRSHPNPIGFSTGHGNILDEGGEGTATSGISVTSQLRQSSATVAAVYQKIGIPVGYVTGADGKQPILGWYVGIPDVIANIAEEGPGTLGRVSRRASRGGIVTIDIVEAHNQRNRSCAVIIGWRRTRRNLTTNRL